MVAKIKKYLRFLAQYIKPNGPRLAYIGGVYGSRNLGDEALRRAAAELFAHCSLLEFPRRRRLAKIAKRVLPVPNAVLAGGTLINQRDEWLTLVTNYMPVVPNFIVFGTGVAHPHFWRDRRSEWRALLNQCHFVGVRGPLSAQLLADAHVDRVEVVGDPVLVFAADTWDQCDAHTPESLGLNIGMDWVKQWGTRDQICAETARLALRARTAGWRVRWFVVCPSDLEVTRKLASMSGTTGDICHVYEDPLEYINRVKDISVFVGTRLHSVVLATCASVPSVMLEYRPKCRDYMLSIGQEDYVIRTDKFRSEEVWERACQLNSERNRFSAALYHSMKPLRERQLAKASELQKAMLGN